MSILNRLPMMLLLVLLAPTTTRAEDADPPDAGDTYTARTAARSVSSSPIRAVGRGGSTRAAGCLPDANLVVDGTISFAAPGCGDGSVVTKFREQHTCTMGGIQQDHHTEEPPSERSAACGPRPLPNARVEVFQVGFPEPIDVTTTDFVGQFSFCLVNDPGNKADLYVRARTCANDSGVFCSDPGPFSVVVTNEMNTIYTTTSGIADEVCVGSVGFDVTDGRPLANDAQAIFALLAREAFDQLRLRVGWENVFRTQVRYPEAPTGLASLGFIRIAANDQQDVDVVLKAFGEYVYAVLHGGLGSVPDECEGHAWGTSSTPACAWFHGWASFLQAALQDDASLVDTPAPGAVDASPIDLEAPAPAVCGAADEGFVGAVLWDLYDPPTSSEEFDQVDRGLSPIWNLMAGGASDFHQFRADYEALYGATSTLEIFEQGDETLCADPVAKFTVTPSTPGVGETVTLDASLSFDPDATAGAPDQGIDNFFWSFGDGATAFGKVATHAYGEPGTYTISLTVSDVEGLLDVASKDVSVCTLSGDWSATLTVEPTVVDMKAPYRIVFRATNNASTPACLDVTLHHEAPVYDVIGPLPTWDLAAKDSVVCEAPFSIGPSDGPLLVAAGATGTFTCQIIHEWNWLKPASFTVGFIEIGQIFNLLLPTLSTSTGVTTLFELIKGVKDGVTTLDGLLAVMSAGNENRVPERRDDYSVTTSPTLAAPVPPVTATTQVSANRKYALASSGLAALSAQLYYGVGIETCAGGFLLPCVLLITEGHAFTTIAYWNYQIAIDPQPDFETIAIPRDVVVPAAANLPPSVEHDAIEAAGRLVALSEAGLHSYARFLGARAAGQFDWAAAQLAATNAFLNESVDVEGILRDKTATVMAALPPPAAGSADKARQFLDAEGFPSAEASASAFGVSLGDSSAMVERFQSLHDSFFVDRDAPTVALAAHAATIELEIAALNDPVASAPGVATVAFSPALLRAGAATGSIDVFIELAATDATAIDLASLRVAGAPIFDPPSLVVGDSDGDGVKDAVGKVAAADLVALLQPGTQQVPVTGRLLSGEGWGGTSEITVVSPQCGNGMVEPPEQCDDENLTEGDGCAPDCQLESLCRDGAPVDVQSIIVTGLKKAPGQQSILLKGTMHLPPTQMLAPDTLGVQVLLEDWATGQSIVEFTHRTGVIPPGAVSPRCNQSKKDGWKSNKKRTSFAYSNKSGALPSGECLPQSARGLRTVKVADKRKPGKSDDVTFLASWKKAQLSWAGGPVRATVVFSAAGSSGGCGSYTFASTRCRLSRNGATLKCK